MKSSPLCATLLLTVALATLAACGKKGPPPGPPPPQVGVVRAESVSAPLSRDLVGRLSAHFTANVTARVSGVLLKRVYTEGSEVKQGQVLFEIDPAFYQSALDNALGTLAEDQATYVYARVTAERDRKLLPVGSVSQQTVDDADATELSAAAKVQADKAAVEAAHINLGYTRVTSPISGTSGQQQVTQGALVGVSTSDTGSGGTLLTTIQQIDSLYVNFTISAADLLTLREAQGRGRVALAQPAKTTVQIALPNGAPYGEVGILDFSDVTVNATTGAVNLRALVPNPQHLLLPGMYVTLTVALGQQNDVILIPQQALQRDTVGAYAMVVGPDGKVVRKDVNARDTYGNNWIVTGGLAAGDQVIVSGLQGVHEGGQAKPGPWQPPAPATGSSPAGAPPGSGSQVAGNK